MVANKSNFYPGNLIRTTSDQSSSASTENLYLSHVKIAWFSWNRNDMLYFLSVIKLIEQEEINTGKKKAYVESERNSRYRRVSLTDLDLQKNA